MRNRRVERCCKAGAQDRIKARIDEQLTVQSSAGQPKMAPAGSHAVRDLIVDLQALVTREVTLSELRDRFRLDPEDAG